MKYGKLPTGMASARFLFTSYRHKARSKQREFSLTFEEFLNITKQNCYLCGAAPNSIRYNKRYNGAYVYNGVDRVDSDSGYHIWNVQPCCGECNFMKRNLSLDRFILKLATILELHAARSLLLESMKRKRKRNEQHSSLGPPANGNRRRKKQ
jgi:hypothetical protein